MDLYLLHSSRMNMKGIGGLSGLDSEFTTEGADPPLGVNIICRNMFWKTQRSRETFGCKFIYLPLPIIKTKIEIDLNIIQ